MKTATAGGSRKLLLLLVGAVLRILSTNWPQVYGVTVSRVFLVLKLDCGLSGMLVLRCQFGNRNLRKFAMKEVHAMETILPGLLIAELVLLTINIVLELAKRRRK